MRWAAACFLVGCASSGSAAVLDAGTKPGPEASSPPLVTEAGFIEVPPQTSASAASATGARYSARMFYSFRPADEAPAGKPLLVLFDGGPGGATTANLLAYGTGPVTLETDGGPGINPAPNPASFTRFGNLLFLDERQTGLSYGLGPEPTEGCTFSPLDDAADYVRAIGTFLSGHPALATAPIVLVGESYGGTRSTAILHLAENASDDAVTMPSDVRATLKTHASQLGQAVLIQPFLAADQYLSQLMIIKDDPYVGIDAGICTLDAGGGGLDLYNVSKPCGWSHGLENRAGMALADRDASVALLGVDLGTVKDILPAARTNAWRAPGGSVDPAESAFSRRFGALGPNDSYWTALDPTCPGYEPYTDETPQTWLYPVLLHSRLFITNARYDPVVYSPAIPYMLTKYGQTPATIDTTPQPGVARPGWIHVSLTAAGGTPTDVTIRFPSYDSSGHQVAVTQGAELADDIEAWLAEAAP